MVTGNGAMASAANKELDRASSRPVKIKTSWIERIMIVDAEYSLTQGRVNLRNVLVVSRLLAKRRVEHCLAREPFHFSAPSNARRPQLIPAPGPAGAGGRGPRGALFFPLPG